jgi:malate dehydrogenase (oxaloacetate-decarboxylating)
MDIQQESLEMHAKLKGKIEIKSKVKLENKRDLSLAYTPGVAEPCKHIAKNKEDVYKYTPKGNTVAVVSDGSAVLGLGNIGAEAAFPVMEGKAILFKGFANIDAIPIVLKDQDVEKIIETVRNISPGFGGINLEDIKAPGCFEIEARLQDLEIPVMHDDQHGTAVVALAGLINALKLKKMNKEDCKIVISGVGAAGIAVVKIMLDYGFKGENIVMCDSTGIIFEGRDNLNKYKEEMSLKTNSNKLQGNLEDAVKERDVFIGVSVKDLLSKDMVRSMNEKPVIIAMANPDPEILPEDAKEAGAFIVATGRSDFPNQVNNVLAFPGIFRGALDARAERITEEMKVAAAEALANVIENVTVDEIIPSVLNKDVAVKVAEAVKNAFETQKKAI